MGLLKNKEDKISTKIKKVLIVLVSDWTLNALIVFNAATGSAEFGMAALFLIVPFMLITVVAGIVAFFWIKEEILIKLLYGIVVLGLGWFGSALIGNIIESIF